MAITPYTIPFAASSLAARRSGDLFVGMRRELDELQRQMATGQKSQTFGGLGLERRAAMAGSTKSELSPPKFDPGSDGRTSAQVAAEDRLKLAIDILNSEIAGRHVFAGRASDKAPVIDYKT